MSILQQPVDIFVTYVENDGPLLRIWAQLERTQATLVERLILQLSEQFERGLGRPSAIKVGQLCCARYSDGVYYRARVTRPPDMSVGQVAVHFIDYGNSEFVSVSDIRSLEESLLTRLASVSDQATEFFLAGVVPFTSSWNENSLAYIRQALCYEELKSVVVAQIGNKRLIKVLYNNDDFAQILIAHKVGVAITIPAQQILLQGYFGLDSAPPQFSGFAVPPPQRMLMSQLQGQAVTVPPVPAIRIESNSEKVLRNAPSVRETLRIFTSPVLELNSEHMVYVSYVEDGPLSFAIQLQAAEEMLSAFMDEMNNSPAIPLTQPLIPGSVCLGRFTEDKTLCRAVVMAVLDDKCRLYYVDFGNSEILPYSEIFELPEQFITPKVMALRFALAGLKNLTITDEIKSCFKEVVTEKLLHLRVVPPEGPPLKQYGELKLDGTNVLDLLVQKMKEKQVPLNYPVMPVPPVGMRDSVKVSYVIDASTFYIQFEANTEALNSVMSAIEAICSGAAPFLEVDQLQIGLPCCAQYSEDKKWYRAKILSLSSGLAEIMYVDYGNTDSVPLSSLRCIDPSYVKVLNTQAVLCCLSGFQENVNEDLAAKFEEITLDKTLTMVVKDKLPNDIMLVELYDDSSGSHANIGAQLLSGKTAQETTGTQNQLSMYNSQTEDDGWQEAATEVSLRMPNEELQCERKQQMWGGGTEKSNQRGSRSQSQCREAPPSLKGLNWRYSHRKPRSDKNMSELRSQDRGGGGGDRPWRNKESANWRQDNGEIGARGKWGSRADGERIGGEKWNSRGGDERRGKSWKDSSVGIGSGNKGGDFKKSWNQDEDGGNQSGGGRWNPDEGQRRRKWIANEDDGSRRNKWRNDGDDSQRRGGASDISNKWRGNRADDDNAGSRGGHKPWGKHDQSGKRFGFQKNNQNENVKMEVWRGSKQATTKEWGDDDAKSTIPGSIPEAAVQIGDIKPVEVVFLASPEEFCVQVTSERSKLTSVMEGIASTCGTGGGNSVPSASLIPGIACVAHYSEDGTAYRAIVESVDSSSAVVLFCDYGNREEVPLDKVKEISPEYLSLPIQGLMCRLLAAKPQHGVSWSEEEIAKFTTMTEEKNLQAHFINKSNGVYEVVLQDTDTGINLNEQFSATAERAQAAGFKAGDIQSHELALPDQSYIVQTVVPEMEDIVTVTWFINPEQFYCQLLTSQLAVGDMMNAIQTAYQGKTPLTSSVQVGSPVIAKFLTDGVLYRAEVKEVPDASSLIVQFVDYGNTDLVARSSVWDMEKRFMTLPKQALPCCLRGVKAPDLQWSRGGMGVDKYFEAEKFSCTFHDCEQSKYSVSLISDGKSIADQLIADGLAVAQVVHSRTVKTADTGETAIDLSLLPGQIIAAHVTCVRTANKFSMFCVHLNPVLAKRIQAFVDEHVQKSENMHPVQPDSLAVHNLCIASRDGTQWYRGEIFNVSASGAFIYFIDIGDRDQIPLDKVLVIPPELAKYAPQAVECCVAGNVSSVIVPDMDVVLSVNLVYRKRLIVTLYSVEGKRLEPLKDTDHEPLLEVSLGFPVPMMSEERNFDQGQLFEELPVDLFAVVSKEIKVYQELPSDVDPVCPLPVMSKMTKMWVSHIEGPDSLWLQRVCDADTVAELLENMYTFYEAEEKGVNLEISEDKLCAAKSGNDNQWYRGKILYVNVNDGTCTVLFIDYGNSETIPAAHVKELDASLFTPHAQAVCTALAVEFDKKEQITSELLEITADKEFTVVFGLKKENVWLVDLFLDWESISKKLVDLGLVKGFEAHLFRSELKEGSSCAVFVSHIDSPCCFWVQKAEDSQEILKLQDELQVAAGMLENITSPPPVGAECIGMFAEAWYRAVVLESNLSLVTVCFIDYGNVEIIDVTSEGLKPLPEKLQNIPGYAEKCSLLGSDGGYTFHTGAAEKMEVLLGGTDKPVTAHVLSGGEIKHVNLVLADRNNVLMTLVYEGFATKTGFTEQMSVVDTHITGVPAVDAQITEEITSVGAQVTEDISVVVDTQVTEDISVLETEASKEFFAAYVSYIKSPLEFWIQYESDTSQIEEMENRLLEAESFSVLDAPVEGMLCAAKFTDETWYRAKVLQVTDGVEVLFLDYGNHSLSSELRSLPEDLISVHPLAKCCSLCLPDGVTEWSTVADEKFNERAGAGCTQFLVNILEEGDCAVVSLLEGGRKIEEELLNLCTTVDEAPTVCVKPSKLHACVSHVISPFEFWIQLESSLLHLNEISSQLAESDAFPTLNNIEESVLCVAQFPYDESWYRARILSHSDDCVEVMYVDFGNTSVSTELRELPDELKDIPPLAKKCSLSISSDILERPETVSDAFVGIVGEMCKLFEIEIIRDGDPAVISMWYDGKKVDEELLKIVEPKRKNVEPAESEILTETCPDERKEGSVYNEEEVLKEGIENLSENDNVKQVKEQQETYDEYSIKYFEGINDILMSKKQNKGIREEAQVEIIEQGEDKKEEDVAKNFESFSEKGEESNEHQNEEKIIVDNVQNRANIVKEHQIEDKACSDNFTSQEPEESEENVSAENTKMISTKESTKDVSDSLNADTVIKTDENGKDKVSKENVQERSLDNTCTVINTGDENGKDTVSKENVQERSLDNTCTVINTDDENGEDKVSKENVQERSLDNTCTVINTGDENGKDKVLKENVQERSLDNTSTVINTDDAYGEDKVSKENVQERSLDNTCTVINTDDENGKDKVSKENVQEISLDNTSTVINTDDAYGEDKVSKENVQERSLDNTCTVINTGDENGKDKVSKENVQERSLDNTCTVINTGDENGKDKVSKENVQERSLDNTCTVINTDENGKDKISKDDVSPELHFQRTQHTEKLVREINIEIKTPSETMSKTPMCRYAERIVPASISRGQSKEELDAVQNRSATPKLKHAEKIVPGCISHSRLADSDKGDKVKSAPTTPIVSRSERTLQRVLSYEECGQRTPTSPKLIHDDRIVPGSISREESQEETYPFPPQLPHAEKIVPGSISRDISDEALESKLLQAAVMETPDQRSAEADPTSVAEVQP